MTVKSADKKPEKYVGPDGKPKIRMVSVDKEVVKSEAYDEPQGQAKRIASPLQKARMDKEKADRDKDGKLKSEDKSFKDFREANTPVGQRDKMKIIDRKPHPDGGHIVTMQTKAGKTIKRHLKNGKVKDMKESVKKGTHISDDPKAQERIEKFLKGLKHQPKGKDMKDMFGFMMKQMGYNPKTGLKEAVSKLPGGNKHLATAGTKATIMHPVTRVSKKVDKKDLKKHVDAGWMHMGTKRNRVTKGPFKPKEGYASDAQRKAVWASKNEKDKKESVAESFDHTDHEDNAFAHGMAHQHHKEHGHNDLAAHHLKASDHHEKALKHYGDGNKQKGAEHARKAMSHASKAYEASLDKSGEHHKVSHDAFVSSMKTIQKTPVTRKEEVELDEISKKTARSYLDKTKGDDAFSGTRKANNRLKGAIHAVGKLRKEEFVELDEVATPAMKKAGTELNAYAKKSGGIDKADFMKAADMLSSGKAGMAFIKFVNGQDTEVFEKIISVMSKHMGRQTVEKMFKVRVREEVNDKKKTFNALRGNK